MGFFQRVHFPRKINIFLICNPWKDLSSQLLQEPTCLSLVFASDHALVKNHRIQSKSYLCNHPNRRAGSLLDSATTLKKSYFNLCLQSGCASCNSSRIKAKSVRKLRYLFTCQIRTRRLSTRNSNTENLDIYLSIQMKRQGSNPES